MRYGISEANMKKIIDSFTDFNDVERVILFGSRAKGNFNDGSDIDLSIDGKELTLQKVHKLENNLDNLDLPYMFDILVYNKINNDQLKEHIDRVGIELYNKNNL